MHISTKKACLCPIFVWGWKNLKCSIDWLFALFPGKPGTWTEWGPWNKVCLNEDSTTVNQTVYPERKRNCTAGEFGGGGCKPLNEEIYDTEQSHEPLEKCEGKPNFLKKYKNTLIYWLHRNSWAAGYNIHSVEKQPFLLKLTDYIQLSNP